MFAWSGGPVKTGQPSLALRTFHRHSQSSSLRWKIKQEHERRRSVLVWVFLGRTAEHVSGGVRPEGSRRPRRANASQDHSEEKEFSLSLFLLFALGGMPLLGSPYR